MKIYHFRVIMLQFFAFLLLSSGAFAQVPGAGRCPEVKAVQNFDLSQYLNVWYEAEKYFLISEKDASCVTANLTLNTDGTIKIIKKQYYPSVANPTTTEYKAKFSGNNTEGKWNIGSATGTGSKVESVYWILDTDYTSYTVSYACHEQTMSHIIVVWIWTRQQEAPQSVLDKVYKVLDKYNLSKTALMKVDQKNCS